MKSKRVGHGHLKWAVCSALLSASTLAAAAPREIAADGIARLQGLKLPVPIESLDRQDEVLHPSLAGLTGRHHVLVRLQLPSVGRSGGQVTAEQIASEQAAFISRALSLAPSTNVVATLAAHAERGGTRRRRGRSARACRGHGDHARGRRFRLPASISLKPYPTSAPRPRTLWARAATVFASQSSTVASTTRMPTSVARALKRHMRRPGRSFRHLLRRRFLSCRPALATCVVDDPGTAADDGLFPSAKVIGG